MKAFYLLTALLLTLNLTACSSKQVSSSDAQKSVEERYNARIGQATKADFTQEFGPANWCRQNSAGLETCRFYKKIATVWMGDATNRTHRETFDEVIADFDANGVLRTFKANSQR